MRYSTARILGACALAAATAAAAPAAISGWTLTWTFADGQTISSSFNGNFTQTGANVSVQSRFYDANIPAAGTLFIDVGFVGTWNNITNSIPASFALNATTCT